MLPFLAIPAIALAMLRISDLVSEGRRCDLSSSGRKLATPFDIMAWLLLVLFLGLRATEVGTDTRLYQLLHFRLDASNWGWSIESSPQETGFVVFSLTVKTFSHDHNSLFVACAGLTLALIWVAFRRLDSPMTWAIFLFIGLGFYLSLFNVMRQGVALALIFLGIATVLQRGAIRSLPLFTLAAMFHTSALLVIPPLLIVALKRNRFLPMLAVVAVSVLTVTGGPGRDILNSFTAGNERYVAYSEDLAGFSLGTLLILLARVGLLGWVWLHAQHLDEIDLRLLRLAALGIPFLVAGIFNPVLARMEFYFAIMLVPVLAKLCVKLRSPQRLLVGAAVTLFYFLYMSNFGDLVPYAMDHSLFVGND